MKFDTVLPVKVLTEKADRVLDSKEPYNNQVRKSLPFWRWLFAFFTLIIVPTCQSMPTQITIVNDMQVQNIQIVSGENETKKKDE